MINAVKPCDPDYGLTFEERTERRLKEAQEKIRELKEVIERETAKAAKWTLEIARLQGLLSNTT